MESNLAELRAWLESRPGPGLPRATVVVGAPGSGCTTMVRRAVTEAGMEVVWLSCGGVGGVDIPSAAASAVAVSGRRKVIVCDEADALAAADPHTFSQVAAAVKTKVVPVVMITHSLRNKVADVLPRGAPVIHMAPPAGGHVSAPVRGLDGAAAALSGTQEAFRGDGIASGAVYDNFLVLGGTGLEDAAHISDAFSAGDVISQMMYRAGTYDDPFAAYPIAVAASRCRGPTAVADIGTFGTVWSKTNAAYAKQASARHVEEARRVAGLPTRMRPHDGVGHLRLMIAGCTQAKRFGDAADLARRAGLTPGATLDVMRLWKTPYPLATHARVKKLMLVDGTTPHTPQAGPHSAPP